MAYVSGLSDRGESAQYLLMVSSYQETKRSLGMRELTQRAHFQRGVAAIV